MDKKVSIIVPVYNCEKYLKKCLQSIVDQTYKNTEIIIVDDGSTDRTVEICDSYAEKYPNVTVIHQSNKGVGVTRNVGVDHATGDYITYVDADDYISKDCIENAVEIAEKYHVDMVEFGKVFMQASKNVFINCNRTIEYLDTVDKISDKRKTMRDTAWGRLYTKELISKVQFPDLNLSEDAIYANDIFKHCKSMVKYNYPLYVYRAYHESLIRGRISLKTIKTKIKQYETNYFNAKSKEEKNYFTKEMINYCKTTAENIIFRNEQIVYHKHLKYIFAVLDSIKKKEDYNGKDELNSVVQLVKTAIQESKTSRVKRIYKQMRNIYSRFMGSFKTLITYEFKI